MPDPIPSHGGILTEGELAACRRVLRALRTPVCASVVLSWGSDETRAYVSLSRAGYAASVERRRACAACKPSAPFRWDRVSATLAGLEWLRQVECGAADTGCEHRAT